MVTKTADGPPDNTDSAVLFAIWSRQEPMIFMVRKTADGPPDNAYSALILVTARANDIHG
jgi:hypothetical protein